MAVIYLFDANKNLRRPVRDGVQEIIHYEGEYTAVTQILTKDAPKYGDYFGFMCVDGRFRMFRIDSTEIDDEAGTCMMSGTDAAIAELDTKIIRALGLRNTTALNAITDALEGTDWSIGEQTGDGEIDMDDVHFVSRWTVIKNAALVGKVRVVPYYEFAGNKITGKKVDVLDKTPVFSGLIYTRKRGAQSIHITREGVPFGRVYALGKIVNNDDEPEQVTIAGAVWSAANGDPADKPYGQLYIDLPNAISDAEYTFEDKREEDPLRLMEKAFDDLKSTGKPVATGTAYISDMEWMPGYEHKRAEMWMLAVVRTEAGESVETTIVDIERYYVHRELTKITVGDEKTNENALENLLADMQKDLLDAIKRAGGAGAGAGIAEKMVLEAKELIQLNSERIEGNAREILLRATSARVEELENETLVKFEETRVELSETRGSLTTVKQDVDNAKNTVSGLVGQVETLAGEVALRAYEYTVNELGERVKGNEAQLRVQAGQIESAVNKTSALEGRMSRAESTIVQQGDLIASRVSQSDFTALREHVSDAESTIEQQAGLIKTKVAQSDFDALGERVKTAESGITQQASKLDAYASVLDAYGKRINSAELVLNGSSGEAGLISRVENAESSIIAQGTQIRAKADLILLEGYVKADELEAEIANINRFFSGETYASSMGISGNLYAQNVNFPGNVSLLGRVTRLVSLTMGDVASHTFFGAGTGTSVDLRHSHKVSVNSNGTVTLGEVSSTGGSFNMADTKFYKDGVSAAYNTGKTDWSPVAIERSSYDTDAKTVTTRALNAAGVPVLGLEVIDASEIWDAGSDDGYDRGKTDWSPASIERYDYSLSARSVSVRVLNAAGVPVISGDISANEIYNWGYIEGDKSSGGYSDGYNAGKLDWTPVNLVRYDYSTSEKTISVRALNAAGVPVIAGAIDASEIYNAGVAAGGDGEGGYNDGYNAGKLDWNPVSLVRYDYSVSAKTVSVRAVNVAGVPVIAGTIDASEIYTAGADEVTLSQSGWLSAQNTVTASNGETETINLPPISFEESDWMGDDPYKMIRVSITEADGSKNLIRSLIVYSNGVSGDVTLSQTGWTGNVNVVSASNGKQVSVLLPAFATSVDPWNSLHKTYARFYSTNADGSLQFQRYAEVDATSVYEAGAAESLPTSISRTGYSAADKTVTVKASNDQGDLLTGIVIDAREIYAKGQSDWSPATLARYSYSTSAKTVSVRALNEAGVPVIAGDINASEIWQAGYDAASEGEGGYDEGYEQGKTDWKPERINRPAYDVEKKTITVRATNAIGVPLIAAEVIASEIWDAGSDDGYARGKTDWNPVNLERAGYSTSEKTVTVRAANAAEVPLIGGDIDASEIWDAGSTDGYGRGKTDWNPVSLVRYDYSVSAKTVSVRAVNAADVPVIGGTIDASEIWQAGFEAGAAENGGYDEGYEAGRADGYSAGYAQGKTDWSPVAIERSGYSTSGKTVTVRALNAAGVPVLGLETISASEIFDSGYSYGHDDGWSEAEDNVTIGYDIDGQRLSTYRVLITGTVWADLAGKTVATGSINRTLSV